MEVLVLNNSYEPLQIVSLKKAIKLLCKERAEIVKIVDDKYFSSVEGKRAMPSVIRLFQHVKIKRKPLPYSRKNILIRDKYTCQYCGKKNIKMSIDHIFPVSKGGKDTWTNVVACCLDCNVSKSDKILNTTNFKLLSTPKEPTFFHHLQNRHTKRVEWKEYMFY